jgi:hypothetical protein
MPRTGTTRLGRPYGGTLGILGTTVTPTATAPPYPSTSLEPAIKGLITPGLVPDIARQSAEVAAGRGVAGSPAGDSTAVKMSEQNYLQRLALANSLLSGEAERTLPYQITPFQTAGIGLRQQELQNQRDIASLRWPGGVGGGQHPAGGSAGNPGGPWSTNTGVTIGQQPVASGPFTGTRPASGDMNLTNWISGRLDTGNDLSIDEIMAQMGFGNFGSLPGDSSTGSPDLGYLNQ